MTDPSLTPFQVFRLWARRAPTGERLAAAMASVLILALLVWVLVPTSGADSDALSTDTAVALPTGGTAAATAEGAKGAVGVPARNPARGQSGPAVGAGSIASRSGAGPVPGASPTAVNATRPGRPASCPGGTAVGVSDKSIEIAVILVAIVGPAANSIFGIATPAEQRRFYEAAIAEVNASGGVGCRRLQAKFFEANSADQNDLHRVCLEINAANVYAVLDAGAYAQFPLVDCYARARLPYFTAFLLADRQRSQYYPYLFAFNTSDRLYRDAVLALRSRGYFDRAKGFEKLGFVYRTCDKVLIDNQTKLLREIVGSDVVTYDFGCPNALASPSDIQQAVLKFKSAGVTHVTTAAMVGDFANFTKTAEQQGFRPRYGIADDSVISLSYGTLRPDYNNIANTIAIAENRNGEERTPGTKRTAGTVRCDAALQKYGNLGTTYKLSATAGNACSLVWMFDAAVENATTIERTGLAPGLQRAKAVEFSFPQGPNDLSGVRNTTGGQFWRPVQFYKSCDCWRVLEAKYRPSFL